MNRNDFHRTMVIQGKVLNYRMLGNAKLGDYKLAYNAYSSAREGGVLDIEKCKGKQVIGILYELSEEALKKIDIREGSKYKRILVEVSYGNNKMQAYTYVIKEKLRTKANIKYSGIVYHAMLDHDFPKEYIEEFIKTVRISAYGSEENYFRYKVNKDKELYCGRN